MAAKQRRESDDCSLGELVQEQADHDVKREKMELNDCGELSIGFFTELTGGIRSLVQRMSSFMLNFDGAQDTVAA